MEGYSGTTGGNNNNFETGKSTGSPEERSFEPGSEDASQSEGGDDPDRERRNAKAREKMVRLGIASSSSPSEFHSFYSAGKKTTPKPGSEDIKTTPKPGSEGITQAMLEEAKAKAEELLGLIASGDMEGVLRIALRDSLYTINRAEDSGYIKTEDVYKGCPKAPEEKSLQEFRGRQQDTSGE